MLKKQLISRVNQIYNDFEKKPMWFSKMIKEKIKIRVEMKNNSYDRKDFP